MFMYNNELYIEYLCNGARGCPGKGTIVFWSCKANGRTKVPHYICETFGGQAVKSRPCFMASLRKKIILVEKNSLLRPSPDVCPFTLP